MQCAVIEFARHVIGWPEANSSEFDPATPHPVIDLLPEQKTITGLGGTMRLGAWPCVITPGTWATPRKISATGTEANPPRSPEGAPGNGPGDVASMAARRPGPVTSATPSFWIR